MMSFSLVGLTLRWTCSANAVPFASVTLTSALVFDETS